jgi:transcription elongation GreA/GreB family factor
LKREEQMINQQIAAINDKMRNMLVLDQVATDTSRLRIGHVAMLEIEGESQLQAYRIGGFEDFDPDSDPQVVSYLAPLVAQFIGEKTGYIAFVETGVSQSKKVTLLEIWLPPKGGDS